MRVPLALAATFALSGCGEGGATQSGGYVMSANDGEPLIGGSIVVKASPTTGSNHAAMFTQVVPPGGKIPMHSHGAVDEFFFVHSGMGAATLGALRTLIGPGDVIFIPEGTDHKIENLDLGNPLEVAFFVSKPGMEKFFREMNGRVGEETRPLTLEELNSVASRYGDHFKELP
jgi:mannose-6-phosphate isomerase-like protein (cupin superfamily)